MAVEWADEFSAESLLAYIRRTHKVFRLALRAAMGYDGGDEEPPQTSEKGT